MKPIKSLVVPHHPRAWMNSFLPPSRSSVAPPAAGVPLVAELVRQPGGGETAVRLAGQVAARLAREASEDFDLVGNAVPPRRLPLRRLRPSWWFLRRACSSLPLSVACFSSTFSRLTLCLSCRVPFLLCPALVPVPGQLRQRAAQCVLHDAAGQEFVPFRQCAFHLVGVEHHYLA